MTQWAKISLPGKLTIEKPQGRLLDHFSLAQLDYENQQFVLHAEKIDFTWQWRSLLKHLLLIEAFHAKTLSVIPKKFTPRFDKKPIKLPLSIEVQKAFIDSLKLTEKGYPFTQVQLKAHLTDKLWQITPLNFNFGHWDMALFGQVQPIFPYALSAHLKATSKGLPHIAGFLNVGGDFSLYHWQGKMSSPFDASISGSLREGKEIHQLAQWQQWIWPLAKAHELKSREGQLKIDGLIPAIHFDFASTLTSPLRASLHFTGETAKQSLQTQGLIQFPHLKNWQIGLNANARITSAVDGEMNLTIEPGKYPLSDQNATAELPFTGGELHANLNANRLHLNGNFILSPYQTLLLNFDLPQFRLDKGLSDKQPIQGNLNLQVNSLSFLEKLTPLASQIEGRINALLNLKGTLKKPLVEGLFTLDKAKLLIPKWGLHLEPLTMTLQSNNEYWSLQGAMTSDNKMLTLQGKGDFIPQITGSLSLKGEDVPLIKTEEYLIHVSPDLALHFKPNAMEVKGRILVPYAQIKPHTFTNTTNLSEDAIFTGTQSSFSPSPFPLHTDIDIDMGENVVLDVKGLHGLLSGRLHLLQLPKSPWEAIGELTIREGKYEAYGQNLAIDQGQLIFTGSAIANPGINLRAVRHFNQANASFSGSSQLLDFNSANLQKLDWASALTVGIEVSGHLNSSKIQLFSDPPTLSQADILSFLLLGKPANQANQAGGQILLSAISSMKLGNGTKGAQLLSQLKQIVGVDLDIKSNTRYNQETNKTTESKSVVVGKSLTKRIYVSYNFGLAQGNANVFTLTYLLNKFLSIQVNASLTASGIDLLYTRDLSKANGKK